MHVTRMIFRKGQRSREYCRGKKFYIYHKEGYTLVFFFFMNTTIGFVNNRYLMDIHTKPLEKPQTQIYLNTQMQDIVGGKLTFRTMSWET